MKLLFCFVPAWSIFSQMGIQKSQFKSVYTTRNTLWPKLASFTCDMKPCVFEAFKRLLFFSLNEVNENRVNLVLKHFYTIDFLKHLAH